MTTTAQLSPGRARVLILAMSSATFLFVLTEALPTGLLTVMAPDLGTTTARIGLLVTAYAATVTLASIPVALATRRLPRRWVLTACTALVALTTAIAAVAPNYQLVLGARVVTALAQSVFWIVVLPGTAALFPPETRGKVLGQLAIGNSISPVAGVPLVTWIGTAFGWRAAFLAVGTFATFVALAVLTLFPDSEAQLAAHQGAAQPSHRRFWIQLTQTALTVTGAFGLITFITAFLTDVTAVPQARLAAAMFAYGAGGVLGAVVITKTLDRFAWATMAVAMVVIAVSLVALWAFGAVVGVALTSLAVFGFAFTSVAPNAAHRIMACSPWGAEIAMACSAMSFNIGVAAGSALAAALDASVGVRAVPLAGAALALLALAANLTERAWLGIRPVVTN